MTTPDLVDLLSAELARRGWSQRMLAMRAGVNHAAISRILARRADPTLATITAVLGALGYTLDVTPSADVAVPVSLG